MGLAQLHRPMRSMKLTGRILGVAAAAPFTQAALLAAMLVMVAGCGEKGNYVPVSGVITLDGQPIEGAQVSFQPQAKGDNINPGPGSVGTCDATGRYELKTIREDPGAVPGMHTVRIYGPKAVRSGGDLDAATNTGPEIFPEKYNFRTELTIDIPAEGTDKADFPCTKK